MAQSWQRFYWGAGLRDRLLGLASDTEELVLVGADAESLLAAGFQREVGGKRYIAPHDGRPCVLARCFEALPDAMGYRLREGSGVALRAHLASSELSINAMAQTEDGNLIDPFGGQRDLTEGRLRHIGPELAADPANVLKIAVTAARLPRFSLDPETRVALQVMVASGALERLSPTRQWALLSAGLMEARPSRMLEVLQECGALARLLPEFVALFGVMQSADDPPEVDVGHHQLRVLDETARFRAPLSARWAALLQKLGKALSPPQHLPNHYRHEERGAPLVEAVCDRFMVPEECRAVARLVLRECDRVHRAVDMRAAAIATLLDRVEALTQPERFEQLLTVCTCDYAAYPGHDVADYAKAGRLRRARAAFASVDAAAVERINAGDPELALRVLEARARAIAQALRSEVWDRPAQLSTLGRP